MGGGLFILTFKFKITGHILWNMSNRDRVSIFLPRQ